MRQTHFDEKQNSKNLAINLDKIEEDIEEAQIQEACKRRETRKHDSKLRRKEFKVGDLVQRMCGEPRRDHAEGKFAPNQEGNVKVLESILTSLCIGFELIIQWL